MEGRRGRRRMYDGEGRRVKKTGTSETVVFVYNPMGALGAEYRGAGGGQGTQYVTQDVLGSTRLVTNGAGAVAKPFDYMPFGQDIWSGVNGRPAVFAPSDVSLETQRLRFTGKE